MNRTRQLLGFLHEELHIPNESLDLVLRHCELPHGTLPMLLWQYGLVSLPQLERIFDWLDSHTEELVEDR